MNIEINDLRQWRRPLSVLEIEKLGTSLRDDILRRGNLDPQDVSFENTYSGLRLIVRKLPQNEEAALLRFVSDRLYAGQYGFSYKSQSLRTLFKIHSASNGVITAQKLSMLKDAFEQAYGGWQACLPRFDIIVKASNSYEVVCKLRGEDTDMVEAVLRTNARPLTIAQLKIEGPLEVP